MRTQLGVFLQNAIFRLNLCMHVLDYPLKLDLRKNVREAGRLERFEREHPRSWRIPFLATQLGFHQSWK